MLSSSSSKPALTPSLLRSLEALSERPISVAALLLRTDIHRLYATNLVRVRTRGCISGSFTLALP